MSSWLSGISPCPRLIGDSSFAGGWIEPLRVIYDHELVLCMAGEFVVEFEDRDIRCRSGSFIIIPPGRKHLSRADSPEGCDRCWIHFDWTYAGPREATPILTYLPGEAVESDYRPAPDFVPKVLLHGPMRSPHRAKDLYQQAEELWNRGDEFAGQCARARVLELLVELLYDYCKPAPAPTVGHGLPGLVRSVLDEMAVLAIDEAPSIQRQLESLGYSYAHLCRLFRNAYGLSPLQYVNVLRIERAKLLLRDSQEPIAAIARRVGFDNAGYFCRLFRKHTGQSPSEYARSGRG